ncbi:Isoamyl acetate-hydrolyzing esterase 1-like [Stylophora pistillata]|uniref:Isoamyl acetate-hydrolyzing esterase 1 homolog n=1 Tax=Stylophora pistillata TaxID=50429 RepID=A0A2B4SGF2_STYPI|nr:Isoamyl acetate-hydrolyzing esterase 1-like [Stylophora pistillata]
MAVKLFPKLVLFGDSLTQESFSEGGWGATLADHYQRKCDVVNRGFSGYTSAYNKLILPQVLQSDNNPKGSIVAAIVLLGSNDAVCNETDPRGLTVEQYTTNLTDILMQFMNDGIEASQLVLLTPPAVVDNKYKKFCAELDVPVSLCDGQVKCFAEKCVDVGKKLGVEVVDLYKLFHGQPNWESFLSDGLHFSKEGNQFVAQQVIPVLDTKLGKLPMIFPDWKDVDPKHPDKYFS